jgi:hypothetical protein
MKLINTTANVVLAQQVEPAKTIIKRLVGLLGRASLAKDATLYIEPCQQVHTCFMRFTMDALFVDAGGEVLKVVHSMKPWRFSPWVHGALGVYEFADGVLAGKVKEGDTVRLTEE